MARVISARCPECGERLHYGVQSWRFQDLTTSKFNLIPWPVHGYDCASCRWRGDRSNWPFKKRVRGH